MKNVNDPIETVEYGKTVIPKNRLEFLGNKCKQTLLKVHGNVLEVGVYKGGTLIELAKQVRDFCPQYKVYGIDTFEGHPYDDGHPVHQKGKYADVNITELEDTLKKAGVDKWVKLIKGKIEDVFDASNISNVSFAHIDCDLYIPVKYSATNITPKINKGGIIYFDDYGHEHCPGATKAVEEIFPKEKIKVVSLEDGTSWSGYIQL